MKTKQHKDTLRLNWLEKQQAGLNTSGPLLGENSERPHVWLKGENCFKSIHYFGKTYREVIDKGMKATA